MSRIWERDNSERLRLPIGAWLAKKAVREFFEAGLHCLLVPSPMDISIGGYIRLPRNHPDRGKEWQDIEMQSVRLSYGVDAEGWVGFDTIHRGEYWVEKELRALGLDPQEFSLFSNNNKKVRWTLELDELVALSVLQDKPCKNLETYTRKLAREFAEKI